MGLVSSVLLIAGTKFLQRSSLRGMILFGSWLEGTVHYDRGGMAVGER